MARLSVSVTAGTVELGRANADLGYDRVFKRWTVSGVCDVLGAMPEDTTLELALPDGRVLKGHAFLKGHRITSNASGTYTEYSYQGTGPLEGALDHEFD